MPTSVATASWRPAMVVRLIHQAVNEVGGALADGGDSEAVSNTSDPNLAPGIRPITRSRGVGAENMGNRR